MVLAAKLMTPQLSASDIINLCDQYRADGYLDSLDRAELSRHFGGGRLNPGADNLGLVSDNNWQQGYRYINRAYRQIFSLATSDAGIVEITVKKSVAPERRRYIERQANKIVNRVIREARSFRFAYASACGDAVLYGTPYLYRWDKRNFIPKYAGMPLMPREAPADTNDDRFIRWAFPGTLSARDIMAQMKLAKRTGKKGKWNMEGLRWAMKMIHEEMKGENEGVLDMRFDEDDPETLEYTLQSNAYGARVLQGGIKVYYFFQKNDEGKVDCYITNRHGEKLQATSGDQYQPPTLQVIRQKDGVAAKAERHLFFERSRFESVNECLWPLILDLKFGGEARVHRALGLGRLNYDLDRAVSHLLNAGLAGLEDDFTPLYQAADGASLKKIDQLIAAGIRRGSVFPAEVKAFEKQSNARNYGNLLALMNTLDIGQSHNASSHALGNNAGRGPRELEVQALERQSQNQQDITSRMEDWIEMGTVMVQEMYNTLVNRPLAKGDRSYEDREKLKKLLGEKGIALGEIQNDMVEVSMRKHLGAGDAQLRLQRAERKIQNLHLFPAQSHPMIIREWVAALDDSQERADELVPHEQRPNPTQIAQAELEEAQALTTGVPPRIQATTIPDIHLQSHINKVANLVQTNQQGGIDMTVALGISALLEHSMGEARIIELRGQVDMAKQYVQAIQGLAGAAAQITRQPPPTKEEFDMAMKQRSQELQEAKRNDAIEKFAAQQQHRESIDAQRTALQMQDSARKDRELSLREEEAMASRDA